MEDFWGKTTKFIQEKISKQNFDTWIKPIKIIAMEDQHVQLAVPNKFFKDWLLDNYTSTIKQSLKAAAGIDVDIDFVLLKNQENISDQRSQIEASRASGNFTAPL